LLVTSSACMAPSSWVSMEDGHGRGSHPATSPQPPTARRKRTHDRASIRKAHAYGLERIFKASTLTVDELRVKELSDDVAIVQAAMTLSGQTAIGAIRQAGARKTIFSFVVHRGAEGWTCASAHNTDAVPNMETDVIGEDGAVRAANYRTGQVS
jgi:hypothetical protein